MQNRRKKRFGLVSFVFYFFLLVLIPSTHCHAGDELSENTTCCIGHGPEHLPFFTVKQCCELHESDHAGNDEYHIHFLVDDQGIAAAWYNPTDSSVSSQMLAVVYDVPLNHSLNEGSGIVIVDADFYQEAVLLYSSSLSPPLQK